MPSITIRGLPEPLHSELKAAAEDSRRSLNSELLHRLENSALETSAKVPPPGPSDNTAYGPPAGWRPDPPTIPLEVREPRPEWSRSPGPGDATVSPTFVALRGHAFQRGRRSVMLVASEPQDGWLEMEWHWVRSEGEEEIPSGAARISIAGLARAELGGRPTLDRGDVVSFVSDLALDALGENPSSDSPLERITRFDTVPPAALLRLRVDPMTRARLEAIRARSRLASLCDALDRLLEIEVEVGGIEESPGASETASE